MFCDLVAFFITKLVKNNPIDFWLFEGSFELKNIFNIFFKSSHAYILFIEREKTSDHNTYFIKLIKFIVSIILIEYPQYIKFISNKIKNILRVVFCENIRIFIKNNF